MPSVNQAGRPPAKLASRYKAKPIPLPLRVFNSIEHFRNRLSNRSALAFTAEQAMEIAQRHTGLTDFGDDDIATPLRMMCQTISREPLMTPFGQRCRQQIIIGWLETRLYLQDTLNKNPSILQNEVRRPWFVLGFPRTGTTLLHRLLAQDPAHRAPLLWEFASYYPRIEPPKHGRDPRIRKAEWNVRGLDYVFPEYRVVHEIGAELPEECIAFLANGLVTGGWFDLAEESQNSMESQDLTKTYHVHKQHLQVLQHGAPAKTWILKCPLHLFCLKWLLKVYPDARIIQTHRDPVEVLPSYASLGMVGFRFSYDQYLIDPDQVGRRTLRDLTHMLRMGSQARDEALSQPGFQGRFIDVAYSELIKDPLGTVAHIYQSCGAELSDEAARRMKAHLDANRQHKFGKHKYALEDFGLDAATVRQNFADYTSRYSM